MTQYIIKRLLMMVVTLFGIAIITFAVTRLTPGEPAGVAMNATQSDNVSYDDLIEQNRRNLGLDKPLLFNLDFEDRTHSAFEALEDFIRPVNFWQQDARKRLRLSSTIAIQPALETIERLQQVEGAVDHEFEETKDPLRTIQPQKSIERILELMPSIAQHQPSNYEDMEEDERLEYWKQWIDENEEIFEPEAVEAVVASYLNEDSGVQDVLIRGGYAIPYLIDALNEGNDEVALRAHQALSGLTGFDFLSSESQWQEERDEVTRRWNSFWRREKIRYEDFGVVGDFFNIFTNTQFGVWMNQIIRFDFGYSYKHKRSVNRLILERLPITMVLSFLSIFIGYLIAIPIGIISAVKKNTPGDRATTVMLFILYSLPSFWTAQMLLLALTGGPAPWGGEWPDLFPTRGVNSEGLDWHSGDLRAIIDMLWHIVLPVLVLTYGGLAYLSRQMRSAMLESLDQDFIRTARAKGLSGRAVIYKHAVRNSLIPIITISAGLLPELIAGSIIIESIFTIPGMGLLSFEAILNRDYPVVNAVLFFSAFLTLLGILIADLSYAFVDPRIRYE